MRHSWWWKDWTCKKNFLFNTRVNLRVMGEESYPFWPGEEVLICKVLFYFLTVSKHFPYWFTMSFNSTTATRTSKNQPLKIRYCKFDNILLLWKSEVKHGFSKAKSNTGFPKRSQTRVCRRKSKKQKSQSRSCSQVYSSLLFDTYQIKGSSAFRRRLPWSVRSSWVRCRQVPLDHPRRAYRQAVRVGSTESFQCWWW